MTHLLEQAKDWVVAIALVGLIALAWTLVRFLGEMGGIRIEKKSGPLPTRKFVAGPEPVRGSTAAGDLYQHRSAR